MRDAGRIREKVEIVLDSRQVVSLVLGAAVALGVVFYLGVTVGKDLAGSTPAPPVDRLDALDRQAAQLAERLTFPEALTDEPLPAAVPAGAKAGADEAAVAQAKADAAAAAAQAKADEAAAATRAKADEAAAAAQARADAAAAAERAKAEAAAEAARARAEAAERAAREKAAAESRAATEKAEAERARQRAEAAAREKAAPPAEGAVLYTVQVGALPQRSEADALVGRLRAQGLSPYIVEADIPGKGIFYRVRLGRFRTREEAKRYLEDVQRETQLSGFVAQVDG